ncbi:MAG: hypothetical protein WD119_03140, partial [Pirellulaceae bacterium]
MIAWCSPMRLGLDGMNRLGAFLLGMVVGAGLLWGAMHYHVVRSNDGFFFVAKIRNDLSDPYVDIRGFTLPDWERHRPLAAALVRSKQSHLV